ncbi:MAG: shikimate dehydrogenase [Aquincola sp.]|nr:shikimate dehydrogenase [Aquincola sp.]MDH5329276.1 shikimate dehydrogenase [Aquincola sp.]
MTDRYAVIGNPIAHSKSPLIHTAFARALGEDIEYTRIEGPLDGFAAAALAFRDALGKGLNVTVPFKVQAFELATDRHEAARIAGAANALKFTGSRIEAENFDGVGLVHDIERNLGVSLRGRRVLCLGAGGAVRGAVPPILARATTEVVIANRTVATAQTLAGQFSARGRVTACGYTDLAHEQGFDVVINGTSASLNAVLPPVPAAVFGNAALAYDMVYGKGLTPFLRLAREAGAARCADGVGMLVEQAAEAFVWWRGVRPDTRPVIDQLTVPLA